MERCLISELKDRIGRSATLQGWIHAIRDQKRIVFLILRDRTGYAQAVIEKLRKPELAERVSRLTRESAVTLTGTVAGNPDVKLGGIEIEATGLQIESVAASPLPVDPFTSPLPGQDLRLDRRYLDLRRPEVQLIFRVQTTLEAAMRHFWISEGFVEIHTPKLMGTASESGSELFALPYFKRRAYLAQSPQFYKQMAIAGGLDRVFEIAPVFRADPSFTSRHTTEFTSVDVEMGWIRSHEDVMRFEERWLSHTLDVIGRKHGAEIFDKLGVEVAAPAVPFPRLPFQEAIGYLAAQGCDVSPSGDLDSRGERTLSDYIRVEHGHDFLFVTDYPVSARPFYHMRHEASPHLTRSFDLLWKGLEITTGAQREHRVGRLTAQAKEAGLRSDSVGFYLDFFRWGCPPHGGFGLGLARLLMVLLDRPNIRETSFLPRTPKRLRP